MASLEQSNNLLNKSKSKSKNICPRCIEDYCDVEGNQIEGARVPSKCKSCLVCKDCEHRMECKSKYNKQ